MMASSSALQANKMILASAETLEVDNDIPLSYYYRMAANLLKQSRVFREELNVIELYIALMRFSRLVSKTIPGHRDYKVFKGKERAVFKERLHEVVHELEALKPEVHRQIADLEKRYSQKTADLGSPTGNILNVSREKWSSKNCLRYSHLPEQLDKLSLYLPRPNEETLSRHSFLQCGLDQGRWETTKSQEKVQYPDEIGSTTDNIPWHFQDDDFSFTMSPANSFDANYHSVIARQPPSPVISCIQTLPSELCVQIEVSEIESDPLHASSNGSDDLPSFGHLKHMQISPALMDDFLKIAKPNTKKNLETCGVLAGSLKLCTFFVTTLIIPEQESTSDSCNTVNEAEIYKVQDDRSLFPLGWIHTHPSQSCFMSSVDLHTQYSYQVMLPEAAAIVLAPTDSERYGIFHLTEGGMSVLRKCQQRGFHPHKDSDDGSPVYRRCSHIVLNPSLKFDVVDLRS